MLKLLGFHIIDTDKIAHTLLDQHASDIQNLFGSAFVHSGKVLRSELGKLVFSDKQELKKLEQFLHPLIYEKTLQEATKQDRFKKPYLIDIPLFFEKQNYDIARSIVVYTPKQIQLKRLIKRDGLDHDAALKRIGLQMDIEKKKSLATYVIDNSKDINHLHRECEKLKRELLEDVCNKI